MYKLLCLCVLTQIQPSFLRSRFLKSKMVTWRYPKQTPRANEWWHIGHIHLLHTVYGLDLAQVILLLVVCCSCSLGCISAQLCLPVPLHSLQGQHTLKQHSCLHFWIHIFGNNKYFLVLLLSPLSLLWSRLPQNMRCSLLIHCYYCLRPNLCCHHIRGNCKVGPISLGWFDIWITGK